MAMAAIAVLIVITASPISRKKMVLFRLALLPLMPLAGVKRGANRYFFDEGQKARAFWPPTSHESVILANAKPGF
jgi:hypothetical protein